LGFYRIPDNYEAKIKFKKNDSPFSKAIITHSLPVVLSTLIFSSLLMMSQSRLGLGIVVSFPLWIEISSSIFLVYLFRKYIY